VLLFCSGVGVGVDDGGGGGGTVVTYCLRQKFTLMDGYACLQFTNYWRKCQCV